VKEKNAPLNSRWNNAGLPTQRNPEISKLEREGLVNDVGGCTYGLKYFF